MDTTTREKGVLRFATSLGSTKAVSINDPRPGFSMTHGMSAAGYILDVQPFDDTVGELTELVGVERVLVETTPVL